MKTKITLLAMIGAFLCSQIAYAQTAVAEPQENRAAEAGDKAKPAQVAEAAEPIPVAITKGVAALSPENTKVEFVGVHVGDKPDPRLGGFSDFKGQVKLAADGKSISGMEIEFQTASLWTTIPDLTNHLKNADFFHVEEYPTAKFQSTKVSAGEAPGSVNIVGNLTLMGETKEITIPATSTIDANGVMLKSEFKLDRTQFGMSKMTERISPEVAMTLSIGEKTRGENADASKGRPRSGRGGGGGFFKRMDANGDGKLSADEIPERMKDRMDAMDTDGDGEISKEEMDEMIKKFRGGQRPRGGGQSGGGS